MNGLKAFTSVYLGAFAFWMQITLGSLGILLIHDVTGGRWGDWTKPYLRKILPTFYVMAIAFLLIAVASPWIYPWHSTNANWLSNRPFFLVRGLFFFGVWITIARGFVSRAAARRSTRAWSGGALLVLLYTVSFASMDWLMTLTPEWSSTGFGVVFIAGCLCAGFSFITLWTALRSESRPLIDLGNLVLMSVMFWAYVDFMQYLVIWSGQLPKETLWYSARSAGGGQPLIAGTALFGFAIPFIALLFRKFKSSPRAMAFLMAFVLLSRLLESLIWVSPVTEFGSAQNLILGFLLSLPAASLIGVPWMIVFFMSERGTRRRSFPSTKEVRA